MKIYTLNRYQYSTSVIKVFDLEAEDVRFENNRVNFFIDNELIRSYPSELITISSIK